MPGPTARPIPPGGKRDAPTPREAASARRPPVLLAFRGAVGAGVGLWAPRYWGPRRRPAGHAPDNGPGNGKGQPSIAALSGQQIGRG